MNNVLVKKTLIILILLVGTSIFMIVMKPGLLTDGGHDQIINTFGLFIGSFVSKVVDGGAIIITYTIILLIAMRMFAERKAGNKLRKK